MGEKADMSVGIDTGICYKLKCPHYRGDLDWGWTWSKCRIKKKGGGYAYISDCGEIPDECPNKTIMIAASKKELDMYKRIIKE